MPRNAYPSISPSMSASLKGAQRPVITNPTGNIAAAPYRGANWTQHGYAAQQAYRYTSPLPQQSYTAYASHANTPV